MVRGVEETSFHFSYWDHHIGFLQNDYESVPDS